jgi:hypothetical protein
LFVINWLNLDDRRNLTIKGRSISSRSCFSLACWFLNQDPETEKQGCEPQSISGRHWVTKFTNDLRRDKLQEVISRA